MYFNIMNNKVEDTINQMLNIINNKIVQNTKSRNIK